MYIEMMGRLGGERSSSATSQTVQLIPESSTVGMLLPLLLRYARCCFEDVAMSIIDGRRNIVESTRCSKTICPTTLSQLSPTSRLFASTTVSAFCLRLSECFTTDRDPIDLFMSRSRSAPLALLSSTDSQLLVSANTTINRMRRRLIANSLYKAKRFIFAMFEDVIIDTQSIILFPRP